MISVHNHPEVAALATPLRKARSASGQSQHAVADAVGIDQGHYSRIERGDVTPSPELARRISTHFGGCVSPMEILDPKHYLEAEASNA